jgi:hypothetical protein
MNYRAHYDKLMQRAKERVLGGYIERHHVIPKCLGGSNARENIAILTPEEHYVAHQLLVKLYPGNMKILWAASSMTNATKRMPRRNKLYGWIRRRLAKAPRTFSEAGLEKLRQVGRLRIGEKAATWGMKHSEETKRKMSVASKGKPKSAEHRAALAAAKLGKQRGPQSADWINKRVAKAALTKSRNGRPGHLDSPEYREARRQQMIKFWRLKKGEQAYADK